MTEDEVPKALQDPEIRKALVDYYKWVVSVGIFVFTVSVSFVGLYGADLRHRWLFRSGWTLLGLCILFNLLLIKRFVTLPIVLATPGVDRGFLHQLWLATLGHMKVYGSLQNAFLILGVLGVALGFVLNWVPR